MKNIITLAVIIGIVFIASLVLNSTREVMSSAPQGMMAIVASSTVKATVGPDAPTTLFNKDLSCANRMITTYANPILLTFATSTDLDQTVAPTATFGHLQAASTTVAYDAGLYGCGVWQAYGYNASTTITISEFKGFR